MVDRIALTDQTADSYSAYDPETNEENKNGVVSDTANIGVLSKKLKTASGIIVTSIQKLDKLVSRKSFKAPDKNIVFIVDEAHRSTSGEMLQRIKAAFRKSAWIGYTGTPSFVGVTTEEIFGHLLHAYTIREAISDRNVLGFKVDFNTTLSNNTLKKQYLPDFYRANNPKLTDEEIKIKIDNLSADDMDDMVKPSVYDMNSDHVHLVVKDILDKWRNRSDDYRYNALFSTHVGGGKASVPMAMMYYDEFKKQNMDLKRPLKIAVTFSQDNSNGNSMLKTNRSLNQAMLDYSKEFGGHFDDNTVKEYAADVVSRLNRSSKDGKYLDLVIVVNQLLTGFDAPKLNTLYVDRTLQGASLIQAYSRTNRIENMEHKPFGRIVNYRWPIHSEKLMNEALAVYANKASANVQIDLPTDPDGQDDVLAKSFDALIEETSELVGNLSNVTNEFKDIPRSEAQQEQMLGLLRKYNSNINKLKQDDNYDYDKPNHLLDLIGMTKNQELVLTGSLATDLKEIIAKRHKVDIADLSLEMTHVNDVEVNYDYLSELIAKLANDVHDGNNDSASQTYDEVKKMANQMSDIKYAGQVKRVAKGIVTGVIKPDIYPMRPSDSSQLIIDSNNNSKRHSIGKFRTMWGLLDFPNDKLSNVLDHHVKGADDLDLDGTMSDLIKQGTHDYVDYAEDDKIRSMKKMKYRNELRGAFKEFADYMTDNY